MSLALHSQFLTLPFGSPIKRLVKQLNAITTPFEKRFTIELSKTDIYDHEGDIRFKTSIKVTMVTTAVENGKLKHYTFTEEGEYKPGVTLVVGIYPNNPRRCYLDVVSDLLVQETISTISKE